MKKITGLLFAIFTIIASSQVHAEKVYTSIAFGSGDAFGWAVRKSQKIADKEALKLCNEGKSNNDCISFNITALSRASNKTDVGIGWSAESSDKAVQSAMKSCGSPDCKLQWTITDPGFVIIEKEDKKGGDFFAQYGSTNPEADLSVAQNNCQEHFKGKCVLYRVFSIPGAVSVKKKTPSQAISTPSQVSERNCRPNTPTIRCSSQCTNGNCTVTYENGCKMHVQVQPEFDSFNNQWTYPSPQC